MPVNTNWTFMLQSKQARFLKTGHAQLLPIAGILRTHVQYVFLLWT
jgi:hypothetical protein